MARVVVERLEKVSGVELPKRIIISTVEVFRRGGGIFAVVRRDWSEVTVILPCSREFTLLCIDALAHELSHLPVHKILAELNVAPIVDKVRTKASVPEWAVRYVIEELAVAGLQSVVTSEILAPDAVCHGWARTESVRRLVSQFKGDLREALSHWLLELSRDEKLVQEVAKLAQDMSRLMAQGVFHSHW